jgi:DNA-binding NtrC family response regulator
VDNEEDIRDILGITLENMGYDVETAENNEKVFKL